MSEKIQDLFTQINQIAVEYLFYQKRTNIEAIEKIIPQIQEFVLWFLEGNRFGLEEELYQGMQVQLLGILNDILQGIEQGDKVLLHDAMAYGLLEYLKLFIEEPEA